MKQTNKFQEKSIESEKDVRKTKRKSKHKKNSSVFYSRNIPFKHSKN